MIVSDEEQKCGGKGKVEGNYVADYFENEENIKKPASRR